MEGNYLVLYQNKNSLPSDTHQLINKQKSELNWGQWEKREMKNICPLIKEWKGQNLLLNVNYYPKIIVEVSQIKFPNLTTIYFSGNNIESCERLTRIQMPQLQALYISFNKISTVSTLKKTYWPQLIKMAFYENKIKETINLFFLSSVKIIDLEHHVDQKEQVFDVRELAKMQIKKDSGVLRIMSERRIKQMKVLSALQKKFKTVDINV